MKHLIWVISILLLISCQAFEDSVYGFITLSDRVLIAPLENVARVVNKEDVDMGLLVLRENASGIRNLIGSDYDFNARADKTIPAVIGRPHIFEGDPLLIIALRNKLKQRKARKYIKDRRFYTVYVVPKDPNDRNGPDGPCAYGDPFNECSVAMPQKRFSPNYEVIKALIDGGANVNIRDVRSADTPLMVAARNVKDVGIIKLLIESGADVNAKNKYNQTPLMMSVEEDTIPEIVKLLTDSGAKPTRDALKTAVSYRFTKEEAALYKREYLEEVMENNFNVIEMLLNAGIKPNNDTMIAAASFTRSARVMQRLIDAGGRANATDEDGNNTLVHLIKNNINSAHVAKLLIDNGANVKVKETQTGAPLILLALRRSNPREDKFVSDNISDIVFGKHYKEYRKEITIIDHLLDAEAELWAKDRVGLNVFNELDVIQNSSSERAKNIKNTQQFWRLHDLRYKK